MPTPNCSRAPLSTLLFASILLAATPAQAIVPHQFIAKMYTEALGRIPDQGGWQGGLNHFNANGCSKNTLKSWGRGVYLSTEYTNLGYDNAAKVLTLYRGILNREPDLGGFNFWKGLLDGGTSFGAVADGLFDSSEFTGLVPSICSSSAESYGFGSFPPIVLPITTTGFQGTQAALQTLINSSPSGTTIQLAQKAVIRLTSPLTIKPGITLITIGSPTPKRYALMARLVRETNFTQPAVKLQGGAKLKNVWVDGARSRLGHLPESASVALYGGTGTTVSNCVLTNTSGWTNLVAFGRFEGTANTCTSNQIDHNLITAYSSTHFGTTGWADGLSIACENAIVEYNEVVDATDVPIILFRATPNVQRSQVRFNQVLNAGNSAYGGFCTDHGTGAGRLDDFTGASFNNNTIWTGRGHYDITLAIGTRAWWFPAESAQGTGASFTNNTSGSQRVNTDVGIGVSGMWNATVTGNTITTTLVNASRCPVPGGTPNTAASLASVSAGYASGTIQGSPVDVKMEACIGH